MSFRLCLLSGGSYSWEIHHPKEQSKGWTRKKNTVSVKMKLLKILTFSFSELVEGSSADNLYNHLLNFVQCCQIFWAHSSDKSRLIIELAVTFSLDISDKCGSYCRHISRHPVVTSYLQQILKKCFRKVLSTSTPAKLSQRFLHKQDGVFKAPSVLQSKLGEFQETWNSPEI